MSPTHGTSDGLLIATVALLVVTSAARSARAERVRLRSSSGEIVEHPPRSCGPSAIAAARKITTRGPTFTLDTTSMTVAGINGGAEQFAADEFDAEHRIGRWHRSTDEFVEVRVSESTVVVAVESARPPRPHAVIRLSIVRHPGTTDECRETWLGLGEVLK